MIDSQALPSNAGLVCPVRPELPARADSILGGKSARIGAPVATCEGDASQPPKQETSACPRLQRDVKAQAVTVFLVEDDTLVRALFRRILLGRGYSVLEAEDGKKALQVADGYAGAIHLLIADLHLPSLNGLEVARRIRRRHPECKVLIVSGYADDMIDSAETVDTLYSLLLKPFTADTFLERIDAILGLD